MDKFDQQVADAHHNMHIKFRDDDFKLLAAVMRWRNDPNAENTQLLQRWADVYAKSIEKAIAHAPIVGSYTVDLSLPDE